MPSATKPFGMTTKYGIRVPSAETASYCSTFIPEVLKNDGEDFTLATVPPSAR